MFYKLASSTMDPCTLIRPAYEEAARTWLCTGCAFPKPGVGQIDVRIQEEEPDKTALNFVSGCGLGIARKEFLFFLGEQAVTRDLQLGRVFGPDGRLLQDWATFNGRERIIVRGTEHAGVRRCSECGRRVYFAMSPFYLFPSPREDVSIFDSGNGGIVVSESLGRRIEQHGWKKLVCTKLPVLTEPKDGLGELGA